MKSKDFTTLLIRLALGLIYLTAGFSKLAPKNIGNIIGPVDSKMISASETFHILMMVAAVYQIIAGALILSQRYSVIGLILLFPMSVGILIYTIVAGFGFTPIINLVLLLLLIYALFREKISVGKILRGNFKGLEDSISYEQFLDKKLCHAALIFVFITAGLSFIGNPVLNVLLSFALLLFTLNLFQVINLLMIDKIIIVLFLLIGLIAINGMLINKVIPNGFIGAFLLMPIGLLLYFVRLIYYHFSIKNKV